MSTTRFTKTHEWISVEGDIATVGITKHAQEQLGDVVYVDVPDADKILEQGKEAAVVESVKAASEIYAPVSGTVTEPNAQLADHPAIVNEDAEGDGWFFKMKIADASQLDELLDHAAYAAFVAESH